ncbi:uncharacterized protein LOC126343277 isoform X1 [Schistocerca gregaria]|uniref:uncharacterized protein LOC126343277 isoform X1 n=1 Tax=Schistocerca gregaria TaxID=7010 RepID=UPI00211E5B94|nr:uncharacterized protein LOC126343277 isoform X1 [Schistocerca gregaria]
MEPFYSLLCFVGLSSVCSSNGALDIIGMLSAEIAVMILRLVMTVILNRTLSSGDQYGCCSSHSCVCVWGGGGGITMREASKLGAFLTWKLDGPSLLAASEVSSRWLSLVQSDCVLGRRLRRQKKIERRLREARVFAVGCQPLRTPHAVQEPLAGRNGRFTTPRPDNGVQLLAAPLGVHKAVKRKSSCTLQSAKQRFAADRRVVKSDVTVQTVRKSMRL